jgi:formylglycine-generating enzyme required for sulfatase activity
MWYCGNSGYLTHEVGAKLPNPFGLYDMHGNVVEWCEDIFGNFYSAPEAAGPDPLCTSGTPFRVARGGDFSTQAFSCRSAFRDAYHPETHHYYVGFRAAYWPLP